MRSLGHSRCMTLHQKTFNSMEVIVKSSPKIEIAFASTVVNVGNGSGNSPIDYGEAEHSAVLKGEYEGYSNRAISQTSMAVGAGNIAGLKGYYYTNIRPSGSKGARIYLSSIQPNKPEWNGTNLNGDIDAAYSLGDIISLVNHEKYDRCAKVSGKGNGYISVSWIDKNGNTIDCPFSDIATIISVGIDDWTIFCPDKPAEGALDFGVGAFAEGGFTKSSNICSHAEGLQTHAYGQYAHTEGRETKAGYAAHAEGNSTRATGNASHSEGYLTKADAHQAHAEGWKTSVDEKARAGHAEGYNTQVGGTETTLAAGSSTDNGTYAHAEGNATQAIGYNSHSEGKLTKALGYISHAEGNATQAIGNISHAEGNQTKAEGSNSHAEGLTTYAKGYASHAEGSSTQALASQSHSEGEGSIANGQRSHAEGFCTITNNMAEHAEGKYNASNKDETIHSVGIGTSDTKRKNAHEITNDGKHYILDIGNYDGTKLDGATDVATEFNKLSEKVDNLPQGASMTAITYADLVSLRDNGGLVAGSFYCIIDYITTTAQENTQSAGHPFDVIVLALSENTLAEEAYAIQSARDTDGYFAECNLSAWKLWYSLDNDTERFAWADAENGKGVIYRMIDEWNNDAPYDFKNIQFQHPNDTTTYPDYYYTFTYIQDSIINDFSINGGFCYNNHIESLASLFKTIGLPNNVFINSGDNIFCHYNKLGAYCFNNSFGSDCRFNTLADECKNNIFGNSCKYNTLGQSCHNNVLLDGCYENIFGMGCKSNTIGIRSRDNKFDLYCRENTIGADCDENSFAQNCSNNTIGDNCLSNIFEAVCSSNNIGEASSYNKFGSYCASNTLLNSCRYNTLGSRCRYVKFGNNCTANTVGNNCYRIAFTKSTSNDSVAYVSNNMIENGATYIRIINDDTASENTPISNYKITSSLVFTSNKKINVKRGVVSDTYISMNSSGEVKQFCIADMIQ